MTLFQMARQDRAMSTSWRGAMTRICIVNEFADAALRFKFSGWTDWTETRSRGTTMMDGLGLLNLW